MRYAHNFINYARAQRLWAEYIILQDENAHCTKEDDKSRAR